MKRLRPAYPPEELDRIYATPHRHRGWIDHQLRVAVTVQVAHALTGPVQVAADLSCGDGAILRSLHAAERVFGDYAPGWTYTGPIEDTIERIPPVDLFVCCETLEHLDDPEVVLKAIRGKTGALVLSTPVDAWDDTNPEHYWAWGRDDVEAMLTQAGFTVAVYAAVDLRPGGGDYCFGIWGCR